MNVESGRKCAYCEKDVTTINAWSSKRVRAVQSYFVRNRE